MESAGPYFICWFPASRCGGGSDKRMRLLAASTLGVGGYAQDFTRYVRPGYAAPPAVRRRHVAYGDSLSSSICLFVWGTSGGGGIQIAAARGSCFCVRRSSTAVGRGCFCFTGGMEEPSHKRRAYDTGLRARVLLHDGVSTAAFGAYTRVSSGSCGCSACETSLTRLTRGTALRRSFPDCTTAAAVF